MQVLEFFYVRDVFYLTKQRRTVWALNAGHLARTM
jgi:hypothetical protein